MFTRQATLILAVSALLFGLSACTAPDQIPPTATASPTSTATPLPIPTLPSPTPTPLTCLTQPGQLQTGAVPTNKLPIDFIIYLPPCYEYFTDQHYPVLYLLNGQPIENDPEPAGTQWIRIGAPAATDELIHAGQAEPFIIVFPDDRYWNVDQGVYFGQYLINNVIPYMDEHFRTIPDRDHRALGGLSRGGGWAVKLGLFETDLFGSVGLHSPAVFQDERVNMVFLIVHHTTEWPRLYIDSSYDQDRGYNESMENLFTQYGVPHEWHLNMGEHTMAYWSAHIFEYLIWYANGFAQADPFTATPEVSPTVVP